MGVATIHITSSLLTNQCMILHPDLGLLRNFWITFHFAIYISRFLNLALADCMNFSYKCKTLRRGNSYHSWTQPERSVHEDGTIREVETLRIEGSEENSMRFSPEIMDERIVGSLEPLHAQITALIETMDRLIPSISAKEATMAKSRGIGYQYESPYCEVLGPFRFPTVAPITITGYSPDTFSLIKRQHELKKHRFVLSNKLSFGKKILGTLGSDPNFKNVAFYTDFSKAFDKGAHKELIQKFAQIGVRGCRLEILINYLENRNQSAKFNKCSSRTLDVTSGVPQGSLPGTLLLCIFINGTPEVLTFSEPLIFAHNSKILSIKKSYWDT